MNIAVLDGNEKERDVYSKLCKLIGDQYGFVIKVKAFADVTAFMFEMNDGLSLHTTDIIIIDPQTGSEAIAKTLRSMKYVGVILYLTNAEDLRLATQAFDAGVFNFLKKGEPYLPRFKKVLEQAMTKAEDMWDDYILLKNRDECIRLSLRDIYYFAALDHFITAYHKGGAFEVRATIGELEERLFRYGFVRTHKSYLVSVACILNAGWETLRLADGTELPVGRAYYPQMQDRGIAKNLSLITDGKTEEAKPL
jgi:DNA-binding LytR/AlgR family response regulator